MFIQNFGCEGVGHGDTVSAPGVGCLLMAPPSMTVGTSYPFNRTFLFLDFDRMTRAIPAAAGIRSRPSTCGLPPIRNARASIASCTSTFW